MSLCRPLITQVHVRKLPHCQLTPTSPHPGSSIATNRPNLRLPRTARVHYPSCPLRATSLSVSPSSSHASKSLTITSTLERVAETGVPITIEDYKERRHRDRFSIANLPDSSYLHVLSQALETEPSTLADYVALDILEVFQGSSARQENLLRQILSMNFTRLSREVLLRILQRLDNTPNGLKFLTTRAVESLVRTISADSVIHAVDRGLAQIIHPTLVERVKCCRAPGGVRSVDYHPPGIIFSAFSMIQKLLVLALHQQGLELFQSLVKLRQVPPEAIYDIGIASDDFNTIIRKTLVRASLHWNWRTLATVLLKGILDSAPLPSPDMLELNNDVIYALLDTPTRQDIRACGHLIYRVHKHAPVPNTVIRQFYDRAAEQLATDEAAALYSFTRSLSVLRTHHYPPPQGVALPWLMLHLTSASHKTHLSRVLATEVLRDNLSIPLQHCAPFIAATAAQGYGTLARNLWERYALGKKKEFIVGDCTLMIRMVSLFANLSKRASVRYELERSKASAESSDLEILKRHMEELNTFLDRILSEFTAHHQPLAKAPHQVLTSLARADFILGKFADGLKCFSFLARRKELPDLHDVNVVLSALAQLSPPLAVKMTQRMEEKGLRPDAVTFGTILHHALRHHDKEVVDFMVRRIHGLQDNRMTLKSMVGLIRATIMPLTEESNGEKRAKLEMALRLIKSFPETNISASPQTGKYLVYRSLEVEDAILAHEFWTLCLKDSTEWHDKEQRLLRGLIARMIKRHHQQFESKHLALMLSQLRIS